ncbi:biopolymer transporter ExbD [Terasakiispira papahanaumokuakeensis]|uniref:Biopolymer transporter ExbD n=1 Tax=Terasakiispira papahanaumokuakeensis TaxID=197479 RepID=A0A1E2V9V5_9GAMM|nr:biopolymer transporter ExbD [Terasakiispira papahanaumokuakeensis]ODC03606.1 biopolymer transporter ExbD [Terasakiispira papahanaumokuakeensis]
MRRRHLQGQDQDEAEVNLTPMLDVVFIMLIFFIVTTSFVNETGIDVSRPQASTAQAQTGSQVLVAISDKGEVWADGQRLALGAVGAEVSRMVARQPGSQVIIQADEKASTGDLVAVMDRLRAAGIEQMSLAAAPGMK